VFFGIALVALWITLRQWSSSHPDSVVWFRACLSLGPLILAQLIAIAEVLAYRKWVPRDNASRVLFLSVLVLAALPWQPSFVSHEPGSGADKNGVGFYFYIVANPICYLSFCLICLNRIKKLKGVAKLELQTIVFPGVSLGLLVCLAMIARTVFPGKIAAESSHLLVLAFTAWLSYFLSTHRLLDAQYLFRIAARYFFLVLATTVLAVGLHRTLSEILPMWAVFGVVAGVALAANQILGRRLERAFSSYPQTANARTAVYNAARLSQTEGGLAHELSRTVGGWANAEVTVIFPRTETERSPLSISAQSEDATFAELHAIQWVTPERLQRERTTRGRALLQSHLVRHNLAVLLVSGSETTPVIIGARVRESQRPFTFHEIVQLQEFASLAELAYVRVRLAEQTIQADRLATLGVLGASLAHEIRNPLYGIKAFVELIPSYHNRADALKQVCEMLGTEITRLHELLSNMVSIAKPQTLRSIATDMNRVIDGSLDLVYHKARSHDIVLERDLGAREDRLQTDPSAVKQVVLNLCLNAIQAQMESSEAKWIRVATRNAPAGFELTVSDNGPGIPSQKRPRLFERFQTSFARGSGLGLAISRELLYKLGATLEVDEYREDSGAVFRIVFPAPGPSPQMEISPPASNASAALCPE